ncbi:hypothetical protein GCM10010451_41800 [Streptomyces virens]|uniref:Uncharacterized protein n=1 Tax=Streptomyces virens TaxID=285572 RepID=A0ABP6PRV7_9ACTN
MSRAEGVEQSGRFEHLELESQQHHVHHHDVEARGAGPQQAAVRALRLERARGRLDPLGGLLPRHQQADHRV